MSKIFGYTKKGGKDWFNSDAYSANEIKDIKDPEGGSVASLPTAIPSPFARIDLVKTAFSNLVKSPDLKAYTKDGDVIVSRNDEKLVSDCLDLAEMLFNIDSIKDKIKIIVWDRDAEITKLKSSSAKHRRLAETLELYLEQDKKAYNFELLKRFYLIEYNHKIIGCTSPATLFFTTANDLSHAQIQLTKNDVTFDEEYAPLYERDPEFQKYLYLLFKANDLLSKHLTVITEYLSRNIKVLEALSQNLELSNEERENYKAIHSTLNTLDTSEFKTIYSELNTGISSGDMVEVIGVPLQKRKKSEIVESIKSSDFIIQSLKYFGELKPLVLQNNLNKPFRYVNDIWNNTIKVPYVDNEVLLERRRLPGVQIQYPYLTVSDFLEPYLIRLVYPISKDKFFDGNVIIEVGDDSKGYVLPLKKQFFDYFNSDDLISSSANKPKIEMVQSVAGSIKVTLRVPIARYGEYISFERTYYQSPDNQITKPDEERNKGVIVEHQVGLTIYPWIKTKDPELGAYYRIQLIDRNIAGIFKNTDYNLQFFGSNSEKPILVKNEENQNSGNPRKRSTKESSDATTRYYVLEDEFDLIQIKDNSNPDIRGVIIPKWPPPFNEGSTKFSFAIDFGTTNTHIEYKTSASGPKAFDISKEDIQIATLYDSLKTTEDFGGSGAIAIREMIDYEFVPETIGTGSIYRFPTRTVSGESKIFNNLNQSSFALADFNIPFNYEKSHDQVNEIKSNLKWANSELGNIIRVSRYFEKLFLLMRNKVLRGGGNIKQTEIVWFYPSSMSTERKERLEYLVNTLSEKYFKTTEPPKGLSESLAPYYYYKATGKIPGGGYSPVVSIDIGGGTSDVVVFKSNKPILITSLKFAGNSIFGDGFYEYGATSNGLVNKYLPHYENLLNENGYPNLTKVLNSIKGRNKSDDIIAFLFSLEHNHRIQDRNLFSFNGLLSNDRDYKILFLYFYTAIIYYTAQLVKRELGTKEQPSNIVFSGTGSKILQIITPNQNTLSELTQMIFEDVYEEPFGTEGLKIKIEKNIPKEVTCKGGLMADLTDLNVNLKEIKKILTCLEDKGITQLKYHMLKNNNPENLTTYIKQFNQFFLTINSKIDFKDTFGVSSKSLEFFQQEINKYLLDFLFDGLEYIKKLDEISTNDDKVIEETLFFYPLIGAINNLSSHLSKLNPVNA